VVKAKRRSEERPIEATTVMLTAHRRLALPLWVNGLAVIPHSRSSVLSSMEMYASVTPAFLASSAWVSPDSR
jgi:hypothetical protein